MPKLFSLLWEKRSCRALFTTVLVCLDHDSLLVMWTPLQPIDVNGGLFGLPFPIVHDQLLSLAHIEGEVVVLAPHCHLEATRQEVQDPVAEGGV